jgi:diguanylate cyclase (GGDEF)-like protein
MDVHLMKYFARLMLSFIFIIVFFSSASYAADSDTAALKLSEEETKWLESNKERTFNLGLSPYSGFEYFKYNNEDRGYIEPLLKRISSDLGIKINLEISDSWADVYTGLQKGSIDILYGANETPERSMFMVFTKPFLKIPYTIMSRKESSVHTIGDIDKKRVGFIEDDFALYMLPKLYENLSYNKKLYKSQDECIDALRNNMIDAFITPGGPNIYNYIYEYPELSYVTKINKITSDMTFSTRKADKILVDILNKEITSLESEVIPELINKAEVSYNLKIMKLTEEEQKWLENDGTAVVGITKDYLPFEYYDNDEYKGIDGKIINQISKMTGIKFSYNYSDFDDLDGKLKSCEINVLNIAKTEERLDYVLYPEPFSKERDIIVGKKNQKDVRDIFGLEGKKVAVVRGFWHYELLTKNLLNVEIKETNSIQESMKLVHDGKADFLIENPTVVKYYIEELQYFDLVQRGSTSNDSFLYFGVSKNKPELAGIINKVLPIMDIEELSRSGYEEVPHKDNRKGYQRLLFITIGLVILLIIIIICVIKLISDLIKVRTERELLKQREYLLSIDTLTELHNRNYVNTKVMTAIDELPYPQAIIVADMNDLKLVNDSYGHQAGDVLLKTFADVLKEACPQGSQLFRIGGDEFLIILTDTSEEIALDIIKNIKETAKSKKIMFRDRDSFTLTAALGYSIRQSSKITYDELFKAADANMYNDKRKIKKYQKNKIKVRGIKHE